MQRSRKWGHTTRGKKKKKGNVNRKIKHVGLADKNFKLLLYYTILSITIVKNLEDKVKKK